LSGFVILAKIIPKQLFMTLIQTSNSARCATIYES